MRRWRKWISGVARFPSMDFARLNEKGGFAFLFKFLKILSGKSLPEKFYVVLLSFYGFRTAQRKGVLRSPFRYFSFFLKSKKKLKLIARTDERMRKEIRWLGVEVYDWGWIAEGKGCLF